MDKNFVIRIYGIKYYNKLNNKIKALGTNSKINILKFVNTRLCLSLLFLIIPVIFHLLDNNLFKYWYIDSVVLFLATYILIEYIMIDLKLKQRKILLEEEAYYFFEVLTLTLETGRNLENSPI